MSNTIISALGLVLDLIGVLILGVDLIRLQIALKSEALRRDTDLADLFEGYSDPKNWADDIRKNSRWVSSHEYSRHHAEDEVSFNVRSHSHALGEVAETFDFIGVRLAALAEIEAKRAKADTIATSQSLRFTAFGLALIIIGFSLQLWGTGIFKI